jgi:hypothetical protein
LNDVIAQDGAAPELIEGSVINLAYVSIISAAGVSLMLNVYHDVTNGSVPGIIAGFAGFLAPFLCATLAHVATALRFHWTVKVWIFALTGGLMFVSASAGTAVLRPGLGLGPALALCVIADATSMTMLAVLMIARDRKVAYAKWQAGEAGRQRRAAADALAARQARPAARETAQGNTLAVNGGNGPGNAAALSGGNTLALTAGNAGAAPVPAGAIAGSAGTPSGEGQEGQGGGLGSVSPIRRPAVTDDEIRTLAETLADELALEGKPLTVRAYTDRYGGKTVRVSPIIAEVKAARDQAALEPAVAR